MNWFESIKKWYKTGLWTDEMVLNAVTKGKITEEQKSEIIESK